MTKKRPFTEIQYRLLKMRKSGYTTGRIAGEIGIHPETVKKKESAISKGLKKKSYIIPEDLLELDPPGLFPE